MKLTLHLIIARTSPRKYVQLSENGGIHGMDTKPGPQHLTTHEKATKFLTRPGIDPRYELLTATADFQPVLKPVPKKKGTK